MKVGVAKFLSLLKVGQSRAEQFRHFFVLFLLMSEVASQNDTLIVWLNLQKLCLGLRIKR